MCIGKTANISSVVKHNQNSKKKIENKLKKWSTKNRIPMGTSQPEQVEGDMETMLQGN